MERFGEKLRTLRKSHGLTLRELGDILNIHHTYVSQMEKGKSTPNASMILKIARHFNVSTDRLMKDELEIDEWVLQGIIEIPAIREKSEAMKWLA